MRIHNFLTAGKVFQIILIFIFSFSGLHAQDTLKISFGRINADDFTKPLPITDTGANAVIIADIGRTYFEGNKMGDMDMVFKRFIRVKILNRNGLGIGQFAMGVELSTHYYAELSNSRGVAESVTDLHGSTFNLENGIIRETKLDTASIFEEKVVGELTGKKFAMPALKEGSIFDVSYTERSIFHDQLKSWNFQSEVPCLWSDYQIRIPDGISLSDEITRRSPF